MSPTESFPFHDARFDFSGRRALVVGGSAGIGRELVKAFVATGAEVVYTARNPMEESSGAKYVRADIHNERDILDVYQEVDRGGDLHIVVNVAAINHCKQIEQIGVAEWDDVLDVNLRSVFIVCREAARRMKVLRSGKIVNVSSIAGRHHSPVSGVHYVSSKSGIIGLTKQLAFELGEYDVNVNVVCPSQTMTDMLKESMTPEQIDDLCKNIPKGRVATMQEQIGPILFLCSDLASYITGAAIDVNGGQV